MKNKIKTTVDRGVSVRRLLSLILAATMTLSLALPALALEDAEVIRIYSAEDLLKLSEKCRWIAGLWANGWFWRLIFLWMALPLAQFPPLVNF